jgi:hypothetical protein
MQLLGTGCVSRDECCKMEDTNQGGKYQPVIRSEALCDPETRIDPNTHNQADQRVENHNDDDISGPSCCRMCIVGYWP